MAKLSHGMQAAVKEHLLGGQPITRLEALIFYGVSNLPELIEEMRRQGFVVESRAIPYAAGARRTHRPDAPRGQH